ncbi:MAG: flagellar biosynthetic protein FliO [Thermomonas sp.]|uniref:flagellar biosynthetic protein FliO n=1 Tax=Thermomonas sp. TaxID=1971895 RepID=UPI001EB927B1|nr:flagellar biosynthetic protein FliO [Thermomonas sp.]MBV2210353.1 flagellar biosynthetic protein FliO [Thermomonas sp.]
MQQPTSLPFKPAATTTTAHTAQPEAPSTAGAIGGTLFSLAIVLGLIFILAWLARRMPGALGQRSQGLRLVASLPLTTRERIVVVDVGGTQLLLGTGASGTRVLHKLETPLPEAPAAQAPAFAQLLAKHMRKNP